jgi:alkylation response protein AidB-like acyl-CoA dehydrogenase
VKDGDHYVVNGQKVWTSLAQFADWMMLLARTDPSVAKHKGLTYFLVDMHSPGITVRPLRQLTGDAEFNEVFLDDVRVPAENILGIEGQGWQVGITTLMYERLALGFGLQARFEIATGATLELARRMSREGRPAAKDPVLRQRLAQLVIDNAVFKYTAKRAITKLLRGDAGRKLRRQDLVVRQAPVAGPGQNPGLLRNSGADRLGGGPGQLVHVPAVRAN